MTMVDKSAEEFARRAFDLNLLEQRQLESVWAELGSRNVSSAELQRALVRRGLLTNYQVDKLARGDRNGFFYGDYQVLYLVGTGSFARVYRAVHTESGKVVAVKVLRKRFSEDPVMTDQFIREGEMGQQATASEHCADLRSAFRPSDALYGDGLHRRPEPARVCAGP